MESSPSSSETRSLRSLARVVFLTLLLTFIASRIVVILIMERVLPDFFLHLGGTHVHHLNYGIFLLSAVGGILLFLQPQDRLRRVCAYAYGIGMGLTFDEFGMWLHLGGGYWQRASFDAVIVVLSLFGLIAFAPPLQRMRAHHWMMGALAVVSTVLFYVLLFKSLNGVDKRLGPRLQMMEQLGPQ